MEREEEATTSKGLYGGERGAGGKFRKPSVRKPQPTPYKRPPPQTQTETHQRSDGGGWLSKLVDPATRFISSGATRLLPSFVSKTLFGSDADHSEANQDANDENLEHQSDIQISRSMGGGQGPAGEDRTEFGSDTDELIEEKSSDGSSLSEIEQMLKEKTFSRQVGHDLNRLTELLHSRIADRSDVEERSQTNPNMTTGAEATGGSLAQENLRTPVEERREVYSERVTGAISTPHLQSSMRDQVGASPIDIAKAYMGARTSELGLGSQSAILRDERTPLPSKSSIPSPSPKSSIYWPGAMVQDQRAYQTPQTQRSRIGLHNLPRTPYSRPAHTRSTSKLQDGGNRSFNISPNQWKQSHTPNFGYSQVTSSSPNDGFRSVGPIRRIRHKFVETTPFRGANSSRPAVSGLNRVESSDASKGFLPISNQNLEPGASTRNEINFQTVDSRPPSSSVGVSTVHPQSTEMARRILEHLDRTVPTPQKKAAELKLATSWRKSSSSEISTGMPNGQLNEQHIGGSDLHRSSVTIQQFSAKGKEVAGSSMLKAQTEQRKIDEATGAVKANASASNAVSSMNGFSCNGVGFNARPSMDMKKTQDSQVNTREVFGGQGDYAQSEKNQPFPLHNHVDGSEVSRLFHKDAGSEALNVRKKPPAHTFGSKPALTSISITKSDPKRIVSFDNGSGFTFPVSASSDTLSEPSTPSVMPFSSASGLPLPQEKPTSPTNNFGSSSAEPSYSFGSKKTGGALVFSFPSTSSSTPSDGSSPKFNIGSDKKARLSFSTAVDAADTDLKRVTPSELTAALIDEFTYKPIGELLSMVKLIGWQCILSLRKWPVEVKKKEQLQDSPRLIPSLRSLKSRVFSFIAVKLEATYSFWKENVEKWVFGTSLLGPRDEENLAHGALILGIRYFILDPLKVNHLSDCAMLTTGRPWLALKRWRVGKGY
ncbi:hypothetical protein BVC80_9067g78 [Macleaya cordata]|uniref:Uncharacterized protein n=1 Tax=Macleaya cordata TaxID=56857 RepID=A0A200PNU4_MACCD|nr:hypothetical protein BVC80_9067g78 [Macleaya cordata]